MPYLGINKPCRSSPSMVCRLVLLNLAVCLAAHGQDLELWIPSQLDDWKALSAEAAVFQQNPSGVASQPPESSRFSAQFGQAWTRDFHLIPIPLPPADLPQAEILAVTMFVRSEPEGPQGKTTVSTYGQTVVWRGSDGRPVAATIYLSGSSLAQMKVGAPTTPEHISAFKAKLAAAKIPAPGWTVREDRGHMGIVWERPNGRVLTRADREGPVGPLRPEDLRWLSSGPAPLPPRVVKAEAAADYQKRREENALVAQGLARFKAGFPRAPVLISNIKPGGQGEKIGLQYGDAIIAVDGEPNAIRRIGKTASVLRMARLGQPPSDHAMVEPGLLGISLMDGPVDYGVDVLTQLSPLGDEVLADAAAVLYGLADPDLVASALARLPAKEDASVLYLRAWAAAAAGDIGAVELILGKAVIAQAGPLREAMLTLRDGARKRSGRYLWAYSARDRADLDQVQRLAALVPEAERFPLFDGQVPAATFSDEVTGSLVGLGRAGKQILTQGGGEFATTSAMHQLSVTFAGLPDIMEMTATFTLAPTTYPMTASPDFYAASDHFMTFGFAERTPKTGLDDQGYGGVRIWANGLCDYIGATLARDNVMVPRQAFPLPIHSGAGRANTLRIVRWKQMQRIEINGVCALQGFLRPFEATTPPSELSLRITCQGVAGVIGQVRFASPAPEKKPTDF